LGRLSGIEPVNSLDFNYNQFFDEDIDKKGMPDRDTVVKDLNRGLALESKACLRKFNGEALFIDVFQQSSAEFGVNSYGAGDNRFRDVIDVHSLISAFSAAALRLQDGPRSRA